MHGGWSSHHTQNKREREIFILIFFSTTLFYPFFFYFDLACLFLFFDNTFLSFSSFFFFVFFSLLFISQRFANFEERVGTVPARWICPRMSQGNKWILKVLWWPVVVRIEGNKQKFHYNLYCCIWSKKI